MSRALALLALLAYVLPGGRVVEQLAARRASIAPVRVEARLDGIGENWPERVVLELHPRLGARVSDERGERWLLREGRLTAGTRSPAPPWLPELDVLFAPDLVALGKLFAELGIDPSVNELGRCGERDCFVLGGRKADAQLWLDKETFDVVELRLASRRRIEFAPPQAWSGTRFPAEIRVNDEWGRIATLRVETAAKAADLRADDFSSRWVDSAPGAPQGQ